MRRDAFVLPRSRTLGVGPARRGPAWRPARDFARRAWHDLARAHAPGDRALHCGAAEDWLARAHDAGGDGVSYGYSLLGGWRAPYPETSGYIASTFLRLARRRSDPAWQARALRICDWLIGVQNADGSIANPRFGRGGLVFDTGQVLFGFVAAYRATGEGRYLQAARRAGGWLSGVADAQGLWTRSEFLDTPHVYNTRTAWALLQLHHLEPQRDHERVARANLDWALAEQQASGLFEHCAFRSGESPFTHTLAYAAEGLIGAGQLLAHSRWIDAAAHCMEAVRAQLGPDGHLPGRLTVDGVPAARYSCLTGNAQFALCWARLHRSQPRASHLEAATRALGHVMAHQPLADSNPDTRGAIAGSYPVWGGYAPLTYPNWAAKFFVDAAWALDDAESAAA